MTSKTVVVKSEGMTLPKIIWQLLKRQPRGYLELVLDANPGLAAKGPILPVGTSIRFTLDDIPAGRAERRLTRLWD